MDDDIVCSGQIRCNAVQPVVPLLAQPITGPVSDWQVKGNLTVQGRSDHYVSSVQYLSVGNTVPLQGGAVDLGTADCAFKNLHVSQVLQTSSAARKQEVEPCAQGLELVRKLQAKSFVGPAGWQQYGFIAEEVAALDPTLVRGQAVDYSGLLPVLVNAVQELAGQVQRLSAPCASPSSGGGG